MKITKNGATSKDWWVGKTITCYKCRCVYELEATDKVEVKSSEAGGIAAFLPCPECKSDKEHVYP